ncbi:MAG: hypothetical protein LBI96_01105 [Odoribacteraceae bacterium]|nr:hypothetical protein [Odoribacteraceae bacterium]
MTKFHPFLLGACLLASLVSCEKEKSGGSDRFRVNAFISATMSDFYLWNDQVAAGRPDGSTDPVAFFNSLLYTGDAWSYITADKEAFMEEEITQTGESFGYDLAFAELGDGTLAAVVRYAYPGSPAAAVLERGDLILKRDGQAITRENAEGFFGKGTTRLTLGTLAGTTVTTGETVTLTSKRVDRDPAIFHTVINRGARKIGYLVYTGFVSNFRQSLIDILAGFKGSGITDLVLDLRYNPGGEVEMARLLCSAIVPEHFANTDNVLVTHRWNAARQAEIEEGMRVRPAYYKDYYATTFQEVTCNLALPAERVFVLTTPSSASASELLIVGLEPYMEVIQIGGATHGKYTAMYTFSPEDDPAIANWMILPVVFKYVNKNGRTDFKDGLTPAHELTESLPLLPFGDEAEPFLAKALSLITNDETPESTESAPTTRWISIPAKGAHDGFLLHRPPADGGMPRH